MASRTVRSICLHCLSAFGPPRTQPFMKSCASLVTRIGAVNVMGPRGHSRALATPRLKGAPGFADAARADPRSSRRMSGRSDPAQLRTKDLMAADLAIEKCRKYEALPAAGAEMLSVRVWCSIWVRRPECRRPDRTRALPSGCLAATLPSTCFMPAPWLCAVSRLKRYQGGSYVGEFSLAARHGNRGGDSTRRESSPFWTEIKLTSLVKPELVGNSVQVP